MKAELQVYNVLCEDCARAVYNQALKAEGITNPKINLDKNTITVQYTSYNALMGLYLLLAETGHPVEKVIS